MVPWIWYFITFTHLHPISPIGKVTSSHVIFLFPFLLDNVLDVEEGVVVDFSYVRKVLSVRENFSKDSKIGRG